MQKSVYLINPVDSAPTYYGAELLAQHGYKPAAFVADLATTTVAAMVPDDFVVTICDEHIAPADLNSDADFIGITGKTTQVDRMIELAQAYRARGKTVLIGGPYASLDPDMVRPYCDILIIGELEEIAAQLFHDLRCGHWQVEYRGGQPDLTTSPLPRWELYPNDRALLGAVQTSRGCPFECEFCDVIQYVGRRQRHKSIKQVIAELDKLYALGYQRVFLADDNLTVYRRRAIALLTALRDWNHQQSAGRVLFSTQLSIDTANEPEILRLMAEAGLIEIFIGLETPNEESLREIKKRQNLKNNLVEQVHRFFAHGISVTGGMIVGFDADGLSIFERQFAFAMATAIPIFTLSPLVAPIGTPLFDRMKTNGRLINGESIGGASGEPWSTNIIPVGMTQAQQLAGMRWLGNMLYHPVHFGQRVLRFIELFNDTAYAEIDGNSVATSERQSLHLEVAKVVWQISRLGADEAHMLHQIMSAVAKKPAVKPLVSAALFKYAQIRHMYAQANFWEPEAICYEPTDFFQRQHA